MKKYDKYKNSGVEWLGEIPEHWEMKKLKYVLTEINERSETGEEDLLSLSKSKGVIPRSSLNERSGQANTLIGYKKVYPETIVINKMQAVNGLLAVSKINGITSPDYSIYKIKKNSGNDINYFGYLLNQPDYINEFKKVVTGVMDGFIRLYTNDLYNIKAHIPPSEEQVKIVQFLDHKTAKIDQAIAIKQKQIELLKERRQILIHKAVTRGLNEKVKFKDSGAEWIGEIPEHWEVKRLKELCKAFGRIGFRGYTISDLVDEGEGAITISPSNIKEEIMTFEKCSFLSWNKYNESPEIQIFENDILMVKTGSTYGKIGIVKDLPQKATINPQLLVLKEIKIDADYFYSFLKTQIVQMQIETEVIGSTIPTISETKIMNIKIAIPKSEEIAEIVLKTKEINLKFDTVISLKGQEIEKLKEYKMSLIDGVVTGKVKVCK